MCVEIHKFYAENFELLKKFAKHIYDRTDEYRQE